MLNAPWSEPAGQVGECTAELIADHSLLTSHAPEWAELAANSMEPNPFYEPFALLPALRHLTAGQDVRVLIVWAKVGSARRMVALLPLVRAPLTSWIPLDAWTPWQHKYCFLTSPLIHQDHADLATKGLLTWLSRNGRVSVLSCVGGGAVEALLARKANCLQLGLAEAERQQRALFLAADSAEDYMAQSVSGRHRKGYRRLERHLGEAGKLEFRQVGLDQPLETWLEEFLRLEASGWKGRAGTAFADSRPDRDYFLEMMRGAHASRRLMGLGMYLDGKPIALKANFVCHVGAFSFKICFDESYARFSPGVLLELENIRELHRRGIAWMDSCADEDHPMIDRLWPARREIRTLFLAPKLGGIGSPASTLAAMCRMKRAAGRRVRGESPSGARPENTNEGPEPKATSATAN